MSVEEKIIRGGMAFLGGSGAFVSSSNFVPLWLAVIVGVAMVPIFWKILHTKKIG